MSFHVSPITSPPLQAAAAAAPPFVASPIVTGGASQLRTSPLTRSRCGGRRAAGKRGQGVGWGGGKNRVDKTAASPPTFRGDGCRCGQSRQEDARRGGARALPADVLGGVVACPQSPPPPVDGHQVPPRRRGRPPSPRPCRQGARPPDTPLPPRPPTPASVACGGRGDVGGPRLPPPLSPRPLVGMYAEGRNEGGMRLAGSQRGGGGAEGEWRVGPYRPPDPAPAPCRAAPPQRQRRTTDAKAVGQRSPPSPPPDPAPAGVNGGGGGGGGRGGGASRAGLHLPSHLLQQQPPPRATASPPLSVTMATRTACCAATSTAAARAGGRRSTRSRGVRCHACGLGDASAVEITDKTEFSGRVSSYSFLAAAFLSRARLFT